MKKKTIPMALSVSIALSGCSAFVPKTETVSVSCSQSDATLQINNQQYKGSAQADVPRDKNVAIMCTKPGYFPAQKTIDYSLSGTGVADIVGTVFLLLPGIGLFTPGAFHLDETNVHIPMMPMAKNTSKA